MDTSRETTEHSSLRPKAQDEPWACGNRHKFSLPKPASLPRPDEDPFSALLKPLLEKDTAQCQAWKDEVQNLLIFAGLFSAVLTAFVIESYKTLQQDPNVELAVLLSRILSDNSSNTTTTSTFASSIPAFSPPAASIRINTLWFLSLVLSLATVITGIVALQWVREHQRPRAHLEPQIALSLHHMHAEALDRWYLPEIFTALPLLLSSALVIFLIGVVDFLWNLNHSVAIPASIAIAMTLVFLVITTVAPTAQSLMLLLPPWRTSQIAMSPCAYKSPQSWAFFQLVSPIVQLGMTRFSGNLGINNSMNVYNLLSVKNRKAAYRSRPQAPDFIFRNKKGEAWLSQGVGWLFQRDFDGIARDPETKRSKIVKHPVLPLYDTVKAILESRESSSSDVPNRLSPADYCIDHIIQNNAEIQFQDSPYPVFLSRIVPPSSAYGLPEYISDPEPDALWDNTLLQCFSQGNSPDDYPEELIPQGAELCIRLTRWIYGQDPRECRNVDSPVLPRLPIDWVLHHFKAGSIQSAHEIQKQVVDILDSFFKTAIRLPPDRFDPGNTMHTNEFVGVFLFSAAAIVCGPPSETVISACDTILQSIISTLKPYLDTTSPPPKLHYLFYVTFIFVNALLAQRNKPSESLTNLILLLWRCKEVFKHRKDLERCLGLTHPHQWPSFKSHAASKGIIISDLTSAKQEDSVRRNSGLGDPAISVLSPPLVEKERADADAVVVPDPHLPTISSREHAAVPRDSGLGDAIINFSEGEGSNVGGAAANCSPDSTIPENTSVLQQSGLRDAVTSVTSSGISEDEERGAEESAPSASEMTIPQPHHSSTTLSQGLRSDSSTRARNPRRISFDLRRFGRRRQRI